MASNQLPPIKTLFSDTWTAFKGSVLNLFILAVISLVFWAAIAVVAFFLAIPFGGLALFSAFQGGTPNPAVILASLSSLGLIFFLAVIAFVIISLIIQAASILVAGGYKNKPSIGDVLKKGLSKVLPLFLVGFVTGFIVMGGFFLFVVPGIFFAILFSFVGYEIVLNNQGIISSVKRSMRIVIANFWGILGRILLLWVVLLAIYILPSMIFSSSDTASAIWSFFSIFINLLVGWYSLCYSVTLYKQASAGLESDKGSKLLWPLLAAVVGWIVGIIFISAIIGMVTYFVNSSMTKKGANSSQFNKELQQMIENPSEENVQGLLELLPTDSPERAELQRQMMDSSNN